MAAHSDWTETDGALERTIVLESFLAAVALVNRLAELAERENHHPDVHLSYRTVTIRWTTHSAGGITDVDRRLAGLTDSLLPVQ
jgi:4a-hydroxytetrahydrobiopterin dehydratase